MFIMILFSIVVDILSPEALIGMYSKEGKMGGYPKLLKPLTYQLQPSM